MAPRTLRRKLTAPTPISQTKWVQTKWVSLCFAIAIMVITEIMACDQDEQMLSMKLGQNLCHYVGQYCFSKVLGKCVERTRRHCCFNSRLAKIIQEQGRPQIGKGWGGGKSPNCSGFAQDEFKRLDFSAMDFSEFIDEIMSNVQMPSVDV